MTLKINSEHIRKLVTEEIKRSNKSLVRERWGGYDVESIGDDPEPMAAFNFENMAREQFAMLLEPVGDAFVQGVEEIAEEGFDPSIAKSIIDSAKLQKSKLVAQLLSTISEFNEAFWEENA